MSILIDQLTLNGFKSLKDLASILKYKTYFRIKVSLSKRIRQESWQGFLQDGRAASWEILQISLTSHKKIVHPSFFIQINPISMKSKQQIRLKKALYRMRPILLSCSEAQCQPTATWRNILKTQNIGQSRPQTICVVIPGVFHDQIWENPL